MNDVTGWLHRQARREKGVVVLEDALLSNRFLAYAFVRLRYFALRFSIDSAVQAIRVAVLLRFFSGNEFVVILTVHAVTVLVGSFWWGVLDVMRGRVRDLRRSGKAHLIPKEIGRWLCVSSAHLGQLMGN